MTYFKKLMETNRLPVLIILLVGVIVFYSSINISFFGDEIAFIKRNEVTSVNEVLHLFDKKDYDREYYRPLVNFSSGILTYFFEYSTFPYRIFNLLLHTLNAVLLYYLSLLILKKVKNKKIIALGAALLFLTFPIHDLAVIWHTDLTDRLMFTFYMACLIAFVKKFKVTYISILFFIFALLSKEMAFSLPIIIFFAAYLLGKFNFKMSLLFSLPYFVIAIVFILFRVFVFNNNILSSETLHAGLGLFVIVKNYALFFGVMVFPFFTYSIQELVKNNLFVIGISALVVSIPLLVLILRRIWHDRIFQFLIIFILISILPASRLFMKWYLYLPSAGFTLLICYLFYSLIAKDKIALTIITVLVVLYSISIVATQRQWISLTKQADEILSQFTIDNKSELAVEKEIIFLTIPGKVDNYPVLQLDFEEHLQHYLKLPIASDVLSRSNISSFTDEIIVNKSNSTISLSQENGNYFVLFGYEKNTKFVNADLKNGELKRISFDRDFDKDAIIFTFTNGKFKRIEQ